MSKVTYLESKACATLMVHAIPARPIKVAQAVRVGDTTVFVGANGRLYSTGVRPGYTFPNRYSSRPYIDTFTALGKLGVITPEQAAEHERLIKEARKARDDRYQADSFEQAAAHLGITLTGAQIARVKGAQNAS